MFDINNTTDIISKDFQNAYKNTSDVLTQERIHEQIVNSLALLSKKLEEQTRVFQEITQSHPLNLTQATITMVELWQQVPRPTKVFLESWITQAVASQESKMDQTMIRLESCSIYYDRKRSACFCMSVQPGLLFWKKKTWFYSAWSDQFGNRLLS